MRGLTSVIALALASTITTAQPAAAEGGATIDKDFGCGGFVPTATGGIGEAIYTATTASVRSSGGSTTLTCHFIIPAGLEPEKTTRAFGFLCVTYLGQLTYDSRMQANNGGNATLDCRVRTK